MPTLPTVKEPPPFDPGYLRYCPNRPFPAYRFIQGVTPHPVLDPKGHSYGRREQSLPFSPPEAWRENDEYLFGCDLYNFNYWWEAHEAWEAVWKTTGRTDATGQFLQGLIQISAGMIKWWIGNEGGMRRLLNVGVERLRSVRQRIFMGIDLEDHLAQIQRFCNAPMREIFPFITLKGL